MAGAAAVTINPMATPTDVTYLLDDAGARALIAVEASLDALNGSQRSFRGALSDVLLVATDRLGDADGWLAMVSEPSARPLRVPDIGEGTLALLTYTSGTTGKPKGAMNTHGNVMHSAKVYRELAQLTSHDTVLAIAPISHITGTIAYLAVCMLVPMPMVLLGRFDAGQALAAIERRHVTFTVAPTTAFIALRNHHDATSGTLRSLRKAYSGGAPLARAVVDDLETLGVYLHGVYGLTETTSPTHMVPYGQRAPVHPVHDVLSVGLGVDGTRAHVVADDGRRLPPGDLGEIVVAGPQVVSGYWQQPAETANAFRADGFHTGDIGAIDDAGWCYIIDRKKDLINASGFKIWPREVEDVLLTHADVLEAAVVGVVDEYRGETVKAVVIVRLGSSVTGEQLIEFCRQRLAAYKYPRIIEFRTELPKTVSGKIRRVELRASAPLLTPPARTRLRP
jgi:long-chain acyl-CoA synthetase